MSLDVQDLNGHHLLLSPTVWYCVDLTLVSNRDTISNLLLVIAFFISFCVSGELTPLTFQDIIDSVDLVGGIMPS